MLDSDTSLTTSKATTRTEILAKRDAINPGQREIRSAQICKRVEEMLEGHFAGQHATHSHNNSEASCATPPTIALYSAMKSEVDLKSLARDLEYNGWRICYPIMLSEGEMWPQRPKQTCATSVSELNGTHETPRSHTHSMAFFFPSANREPLAHPLRRHTVADLTAAGYVFTEPSAIDAIIVPLVAFDKHNFRLGYGGGNYDNYLPLLREDCLVIGVAFEEQEVGAVPCEPHDLPLPHIIAG